MNEFDKEINQILKNSGTKLLEDDEYDHRFDKYRKLFKQMMSKDWTCKIYAKQHGANDKEFQRLLNEFCDTIELENFEIPGKDAGISWIKIDDRYFDDDSIFDEWKYFVNNNIDPTKYNDYTDGSNTELDESIIKEYQETIPEGIKRIIEIISSEIYDNMSWNGLADVANEIYEIIYENYINSNRSDPYYFLWDKLDNHSRDFISEVRNNAFDDEDNHQMRAPEGDEIDWDRLFDDFYREWNNDPINLVDRYLYNGAIEDLLIEIRDCCKDYLIKNDIIKDDSENEDDKEYIGDDTELDESLLIENNKVNVEELSDYDRKYYEIYNDINAIINDTSSLSLSEAEDYFKRNITTFDGIDDLEEIMDDFVDKLKESYVDDSDNYQEVVDDDATYNYIIENYETYDLIKSYAFTYQIKNYIAEVKDEITQGIGGFSTNNENNYIGDDTQIDESNEQNIINDNIKKIADLCSRINDCSTNSTAKALCKQLFPIVYQEIDMNDYLGGKLFNIASKFYDNILYDRAYEDADNNQYRTRTIEEVDLDELEEHFDNSFYRNTGYYICKYGPGVIEFYERLLEIIEEEYNNEFRLNYDGSETQIDESVNISNLREVYNILKERKTDEKSLDKVIKFCKNCENIQIYNFLSDIYNECLIEYRNDSDNWREVVDDDATNEALANMPFDEMIEYYTDREDIKDFSEDITEELLYYYNADNLKQIYSKEFLPNTIYSGDDTELDESFLAETSQVLPRIPEEIKEIIRICLEIDQYTMIRHLEDSADELYNNLRNIIYSHSYNNTSDIGILSHKFEGIYYKFYDYLYESAREDDSNIVRRKPTEDDVDFDELHRQFNKKFPENPVYFINTYCSESCSVIIHNILEIIEENDLLNANEDNVLDEDVSYDSEIGIIYELCGKLINDFTKKDFLTLIELGMTCTNSNISEYVRDIYNETSSGYENDEDNWGDEIYDDEETENNIDNMSVKELIKYYAGTQTIKDFGNDILDIIREYYGLETSQLEDLFNDEKDDEEEKIDIKVGDIFKDNLGEEFVVSSYENDDGTVWLNNFKTGKTLVSSAFAIRKWFQKMPNVNPDGIKRVPEYQGDYTELDEDFNPNNPYQMGLYSLRSMIIILDNMAESNHYSMSERAYECYEKIKELNDKFSDKELIKKLYETAFYYYYMLITIGDDIFNNTKFDKEYLIRNASEETIKQFAKVLMSFLNEINFNIEGIDISNYSGEDTELDESLLSVKKVTYDEAPDFVKDMMKPIAKIGDVFKSVNVPNKSYVFKNTNNDLNWEVVDIKYEEIEYVLYKIIIPKYTLECIDVDKKTIVCRNDELKHWFRKEENNNLAYRGEDTELDESLILEDDDEEGWEEDSPIIDILKICNSISVEEDIHSLEKYADELYSAIYNASSNDPSEKYKKLYSELEDIAENDFYQGLRESAWDDSDNSQYRDATPEDEEWDKAMDSFYEDWGDMPDYIISNDYNYDISDIIGDLRTLINDEFPDVQDIYAQDNQGMIDESLEDETELEQVKRIIENKDNVNRSELKFIIRWCETCENSEIMRYIEEVRDYCMDSYINRTTADSVYDDDATSDYIYNLDTSDLIVRYATSSDIEGFADKVYTAIIDYLGFNPLNSDGSERDKEYNGDDTELDESVDPDMLDDKGMRLYRLKNRIVDLLSACNQRNYYAMKVNTASICELIESIDDDIYSIKRIKEKTNNLISTLCEFAYEELFGSIDNHSLEEIKDAMLDRYTTGQLIYNWAGLHLLIKYCDSIQYYIEEIENDLEIISVGDYYKYNGDDTELDESVKNNSHISGEIYRHNGFGSLYYIDGVGQDYYELKKVNKMDSGQTDLFIKKDKLNKYFTKVVNNYDGSETELDESKKELTPLEKLIKNHQKYPEKDITEIAKEIVNGNIEQYISLMKEYYKQFEK